MMEVVSFTEMVNNMGFPIAVCVALFYHNYKMQENHNKTFDEFKNVINHNTKSIENLTELVREINNKG